MRARSSARRRPRAAALADVVDLFAASVDALDWLVCIAGTGDGVVTYVSRATAELLGVFPHELVGRPLAELVEPDARAGLEALVADGTGAAHGFLALTDAAGAAVPLEFRLETAPDRFLLLGDSRSGGGSPDAELIELNDELIVRTREGFRLAHRLEERVKKLELALEASAGEMRASFRRSVRARDEERRRVMRDLHDGTQQQLLAVGIGLDLAAEAAADPELAARLRDLRGRLDEAIDSLRDTVRGIYPSALADFGLADGLRAATLHSVPPVDVRASVLGRYPAEIEGAVYFSCVEAIQNAVRHAGARTIVVELVERDNALHFAVRDDGCGLDPLRRRPGAGLRNIGDRVRAAGGSLRVSSAVGAGTTLSGTIPLADAAEES